MLVRASCGVVALLMVAGCDMGSSRRGATTGEPMSPSAMSPTGSAGGVSTGGGVPTPVMPGGAGGVGSGNQPGRAGTSR